MAAPRERAQLPVSSDSDAERAVKRRIDAQPPDRPVAAPVWAVEHVQGRGEREIRRLAGRQKGFVVREQLLGAGLGRGAIAHRLRTGRLERYHRGVYLVGRSSLEPLGEEMAAVLLHRGHAIVSHRSAAAVWDLLDGRPAEVTLTIVGRDSHSRPGVKLHRAKSLHRRDLRVHHGLPVTSPARTVVDLAAEDSIAHMEQALAAAQALGLARTEEIQEALGRAQRRRGAAELNRLLQSGHGSGYTRSEAERRMRALLGAAELPQPRANAPLLGYVLDFLWPQHKLIVEVDGFAFHSSRAAFERDRRRDQRLTALGYAVIRVTWRQLLEEPLAVIARIAQALVARAA